MNVSTSSIPRGYHSVTPFLSVDGAARAIAFYQKAFDAEELTRFNNPDGKVAHAEIRLGDTRLMLADEMRGPHFRNPLALGSSPVHLYLYVEDADHTFHQALDAGATVLTPLADQFYGDRTGTVIDPFGHVWHVATRKEDVSHEEIKRRAPLPAAAAS